MSFVFFHVDNDLFNLFGGTKIFRKLRNWHEKKRDYTVYFCPKSRNFLKQGPPWGCSRLVCYCLELFRKVHNKFMSWMVVIMIDRRIS